MEVDIGGRHIPMGDTILMRRHAAERIMEQPTTTRRQGLMAGRKPPTARTDRRRGEPRITRTPVPPREAPRSPPPTAAEVRHRPITHTREPMLRPDKGRVRQLSGAAPMCHEGTRVLPWAITRPRMEQYQAPRVRREGKWLLLARSGETLRPANLPSA